MGKLYISVHVSSLAIHTHTCGRRQYVQSLCISAMLAVFPFQKTENTVQKIFCAALDCWPIPWKNESYWWGEYGKLIWFIMHVWKTSWWITAEFLALLTYPAHPQKAV